LLNAHRTHGRGQEFVLWGTPGAWEAKILGQRRRAGKELLRRGSKPARGSGGIV